MKPSSFARRVRLITALVGWSVFAFWAFSFSYSGSFFEHSLASRLFPFLVSFAAAIAIPVSVYYQLQRVSGGLCTPVRSWFAHVGVCIAAITPLAITSAIFTRVRGPMHLSGDDAMGVGINFTLLVLVAILSAIVLTIALYRKHKAATGAASSK